MSFGQSHSVTLNWSWEQGGGGSATGFNIKRGNTTGGPYALIGAVGDPSVFGYTDSGPFVEGTTYYYVVTAVGAGGESAPTNEASATIPSSLSSAAATTSIFSSSAVPQYPFYPSPSVTLGNKFRSDVSGAITALRFYKGAGDTGTHIGLLYNSSGTLLAQVPFTNETESGWQQINLTTPVSIMANTTYIVAYWTSSAFAYNAGMFTNGGVDNPPLHALAWGVDGPNGVYTYGRGPQFPTYDPGGIGYWVDVVLSTASTASVPVVSDLTITSSHSGNFTQGQIGATYTITAGNSGTGPTSGTVTVTEALPAGLVATSMGGTGWTCTQPSGPCTRGDSLAANASYSPIILTVNVSATAPPSVTNTVSVSGGGETNTANDQANDVTTIAMILAPVSVTLSPATAALAANQTQQFTATVTGGAGSTAVNWSLNPNVGSVNTAGLYTAPSSVNAQQTVTITATSAADGTTVASSTISLLPSAPTAPANLTATAFGVSQINLQWSASTGSVPIIYLVERCQGAGCTGFAQIVTTSSTAYSDTGLTPGASYSYRVRASDANQNLSPYSNVAMASISSAQPPTVTSVAPASGSGFTQLFAVTVADAGGSTNISTVYFLVNSIVSGASSCLVLFNTATNAFQLENDDGTGWLGPVTLGAVNSLANRQCSLNAANALSSPNGNNLTVTIPLSFAAGFAGAQNLYAAAYDNASMPSGWQPVGTWTVPGSASSSPISVVPSAGSGASQTFVLSAANMSSSGLLYFLVGSTLSYPSSCFVLFNRSANTLQLLDDASSSWLGPVSLGTVASLNNSQCTINGTGASAIASGTGMNLTIPLTFSPQFAGTNNIYLYEYDSVLLTPGWVSGGTWIVPASGPASVVPAAGAGLSQNFALTVTDQNGASNIRTVYFAVNSTLSGLSSCFVEFNSSSNTLQLLNDAGTAWLGPISVGSAGTLSNDQCTINAANASSTLTAYNLTLYLPLTFASAFSGIQNAYAFSYDNTGIGSGWAVVGTWTIPTN